MCKATLLLGLWPFTSVFYFICCMSIIKATGDKMDPESCVLIERVLLRYFSFKLDR